MKAETEALTSTGTLTAKFSGSHNHSFVSDPDRQHIFKAGGQWRFSGVQLQSSDPHQNYYGLSVVLPASLEENGKDHTYSFPGEATGFVFTPHRAGISVYTIVSGKITVSVQNDEMKAAFHFSSALNNDHVDVTAGVLHLKGVSYPRHNTGTFEGEFTNSPFLHKQFVAESAGIISHESPVFPHVWEVFGSQRIALPLPSNLIVSIQIDKNLTEHDYVIGPEAKGVYVNCSALPGWTFYVHRKGTLHFDSLPGTGHAKGKLNCSFVNPQGGEFQFDGKFDVRAPFYTA